MNDNELLVLCSCGHKDTCLVTDAFYNHEHGTVCVNNLWKNSPNWFMVELGKHKIEFIGKKQYDYLKQRDVQKF